jgi:hypothetical protein
MMLRSAPGAGLTVVGSDDVLFPGTGSGVELETLALLTTEGTAAEPTPTTSEIDPAPPERMSLGLVHVTA